MYQLLFEHALDGIAVVDALTQQILMGNRVFRDLLGYGEAELRNLGLNDIHPEKDLPHVTEQFEKHATKASVISKDIPVERKDGSIFYTDITTSALTIDGRACLVGVFRDATERRLSMNHLQAALEEATAARFAAEEASRGKTEFIANVSHEIRTPLNAIIGYSAVLADEMYGPLNAKQRESLNEVTNSGWQLRDMLINVLDMAQTDFGDGALNLSTVPLRQIIIPALNVYVDEARRRAIRLSLEIAPEADILISADVTRLRKAVNHLISNAIKFTADGGKVMIHAELTLAEQSEEYLLEISVTDTGIGIDQTALSKLLSVFTQLESPYTKKYPGVGLGLALAKRLVELHGGTLGMESVPGNGSKFIITIPMQYT